MPTILGIDPGPTESAFCVLVDGQIKSAGILPSEVVCSPDWLFSQELSWCDQIWIEMIACYGMPVGAEVFQTCLWIGRYIERLQTTHPNNSVLLIPRKEIKLHLCRSARANDANVRQALIDYYGPQGRKKEPGPTYGFKNDMWAALAVAHYGNDHAHQVNQVEDAKWAIAA